MAEEELIVKMTLQDELSRQATALNKTVGKLRTEMEKAREEAERTGDTSNYDRLQKEYQQTQRELVTIKNRAKEVGRELRTMEKQGVKSATRVQSAWKKLQGVMKNPLFTAATVAGVALFGKRAVEAFAQAEQSQMKLVQAYQKFSGVSDVPIESIRALASELQSLTGTDDDLLAAAAATLARFDLTGTAIKGLLPLVNDFAILTGRDVVEASEAIGKAFMGNARALKELGINFVATGDRATDLETIMAALESKAGGTGEAFGATAAGGLARAQQAFGDLQEEIGGTLVPALTAMLRVVEPAAKFFSSLPGPIKATAIAVGVLSAAVLAIGPRIAVMVTGMKAAGVEATVMRGKMAAAGGFIAGPWGVAIAAATVVLGAFATAHADVTAKAESLVDTLDETTRAATDMTRQKLGEEFLKNFTATDLEKTPFTLAQITSAVIEGGEAYANLKTQVEEYSRQQIIASKGTDIFWVGALANSVDAMDRDYKATRVLSDSKEEAADAIKQAAEQSERMAYTSGTVEAAMRRVNPLVGEYRDKAWSASYAASALKTANQNAATATDNLSRGLEGLQATISEQQALAAYQTSLETFIADPSAATASAVAADMATAAAAIQDPGDRAKFTKRAIDDIRTAASDAGMKLNPDLDAGLLRARGNARLLETQIDRAVRARVVEITLRFNDSRTTYGNTTGQGDGPRHGGYTDGWISGGYGGPTSDLAPIWASRGEYVLRAGAAAALRNALGDSGLYALNHADRSLPSFLDSPVPPIVSHGGSEPALVGAGAPVINIGEIKADSGIDVQSEVLWALRRHERIKRERS
jgi:hypothetical protein